MADGNFNKSPLSSNNYQSGVRAGKSVMRSLALKAFEEHLNTHFCDATEEQKIAMMSNFKDALSS